MSARSLLFVALLLAVAPLASHAAGSTTARAALQAATEAAHQWQSDAVLTGVSAVQTTSDGRSERWSYMFYSAKAQKGYSLTFAGAKQVDQIEVRPHMRDAVATPFVDSNEAITVAKANGLDTKGRPSTMSLLLMGQATKKPASAWTGGGGYVPGSVAVVVDARTGKFLFKQTVPK